MSTSSSVYVLKSIVFITILVIVIFTFYGSTKHNAKNPYSFVNSLAGTSNFIIHSIPKIKPIDGIQVLNISDENLRKKIVDIYEQLDEELFSFIDSDNKYNITTEKQKFKFNITKSLTTKDEVYHYEIFLKAYHQNISSIRSLYMSKKDTIFEDLQPVKILLNGYKSNYFDGIFSISAITTIVLWAKNLQQIKNLTRTTYYPYVSNDCKYLESHAIYGEYAARQMYNVSCTNNITELWSKHELSIIPFGLGLPENGVETLRSIWNLPNGVPLTYIHIIKNAVVHNCGDVWVGNAKIVIQRCYQDLKKSVPKHWEIAPIYDELFTITQYFGNGFFHFNVENIPRLTPHLAWLEANPSIPILIANPKYKNAFEGFLKVIKLPRNRFVTDKMARAKILYMPAGGICGRSALFGTQLTSVYFRDRVATEFEKTAENYVIVIKRSSRGRLWINHDEIFREIKKEADQYGFNTIVFGDKPPPTFEETINIFGKAVMVIGPHGAGFSNLLWVRPGTVIIEGLCDIIPRKANLCFRNLAQLLGLRWHGIYPGCVNAGVNQIIPPAREYLKRLSKESLMFK